MNKFTASVNYMIQHGLKVLIISASSLLAVSTLSAATLALTDKPLDVHEGVDPNILLTFDDSGSMHWSFIPDGIYGSHNQVRGAAGVYNSLYYNPQIRYTPGVDENGVSLGDATFTAAWNNGYNHAECVVNLSDDYQASWYYGDNCDGTSDATEYQSNTPTGSGVAYYYVFDASNASCDGTTADNDCYDAVEVKSADAPFAGGPDRTDCAVPTACTLAEEEKNFANWYSYYRSRMLLAKTAAGRAFAKITGSVRVSHQSINADTTIGLFKTFTGTARKDFFTWLYNRYDTGSTPLRRALANAGENFKTSGINSPYAKEPGSIATPEYACRQNFNITFTDGYWNGADPTDPTGFSANHDNTANALPNTVYGVNSYTPKAPYQDTNSRFLADYALYYWATDLRPDAAMTNNVPAFINPKDGSSDYDGSGVVNDADLFWNPGNDPANWQHMVNFTVGLGIDGTLTYDDTTYKQLIAGTQAWPNDHVDDLWHAAINSRGMYFSAKNPNSLVDAFAGVLKAIETRTGSSSAPAPSAPRFEAGTKVYQPVYDTRDWHGDLLRYDVTDLTTQEWTDAVWGDGAKGILNKQNYGTGGDGYDLNRVILSYDPSADKGIPFRYASINASQQTQISSADVLNYVRGDQSKEKSTLGGTLRIRSYVLGDIVNSEPVYVPAPERRFPDMLETVTYSSFAATYVSRTPIVYVGANDGMLHGFDADTGKELLAYVPARLYKTLPDLASDTYSHRFYVDGSPTERDAFFNGAWHTVLVGGLNAGGQAIYALDITNPAAFTEANAANLVLWEFDDEDDPDLGYTFSTPQVAKMNNGKWMAIFGNGYNNTENDDSKGYCADGDTATPCPVSSTGNAVLFLTDMQFGPKSGGSIFKLSTGTGTAQDPTGAGRANGLASVALVDQDGNYTVDYIYAGDLFGNLWKFDVTDVDPANWTVVKDSLASPAPLFIATDSLGNRQPITSAPVVGRHASQAGFMVNFGTGKYVELTDLSDTKVQTFYGIWDRNETTMNTVTRDYTQPQTILKTDTTTFSFYNIRVTSKNAVNFYTGTGLPSGGTEFLGWRMDLVDETGTLRGERVVARPQRRSDRIVFVTNIPSPDPCLAGGSSWLMELDATTGQRLITSPFDYNHDGVVDINDLLIAYMDANGDGVIDSKDIVAGSGIQEKSAGKASRPTILLDAKGNEVKLSSMSDAKISKVLETGDQLYTGRRSWIELFPN